MCKPASLNHPIVWCVTDKGEHTVQDEQKKERETHTHTHTHTHAHTHTHKTCLKNDTETFCIPCTPHPHILAHTLWNPLLGVYTWAVQVHLFHWRKQNKLGEWFLHKSQLLKILTDAPCVWSLQANNGFPDNKVISAELKQKTELQKYMKKVMPFVQVAKVSCGRSSYPACWSLGGMEFGALGCLVSSGIWKE